MAISGFTCGSLLVAVIDLAVCLVDLIPREEEQYIEDVLAFRRFYNEQTAGLVLAGS